MTEGDQYVDDADEAEGAGAPSPDGEHESGPATPVARTGMDASEARAAGGDDRNFGWRGYLLLGVMVLALVVAPLVVYLRPPALSWRVTLVVFPLVPALLMAAVAVWATART